MPRNTVRRTYAVLVNRPLMSVPVGPTDPVQAARLTSLLAAALAGEGPAVAPFAPEEGRVTEAPDVVAQVAEQVALAVGTSGSTGRPRRVLLDATALAASASATHDRLAGPGRWVLALPLTHIAGVQVLVRSIVAGTRPAVLPATGFDPVRFAEVTAGTAEDVPLYTALVPTQLHRVLAAADGARTLPRDLAPLRRYEAILVGGAATPEHLLDRARGLGLRVVTTYGMTETCGGCVYDGEPLPGVRVAVDDDGILLAGPVLARGYLPGPRTPQDPPGLQDIETPDAEDPFFSDGTGTRWFRTRDHGVLDVSASGSPRLRVTGRVDDVVVSGGVKVVPQEVERVLADEPDVDQVCVVGVPDAEWGQAVTAVVVPRAAPPGDTATWLARLRDVVGRSLGPAAAPRHLVVTDSLPTLGPGKIDRAEVARRAARSAGSAT